MHVQLLQIDPDLGRRLSSEELAAAERSLGVPTLNLDEGEWRPDTSEPASGHLGYLILKGLMIRKVEIAGGQSIELLGHGDLLRPWLEDATSFVAPRWIALQPVQLAVLAPPAASMLGRMPPVMSELFDRAMRRSRSMAVAAALENIRGVESRLWVLFWHLAERWGKVEPDGTVLVPLRLTHETLSILVGARRPTVSSALGALKRQQIVERVPGRGWRLHGEPPEPGKTGPEGF